MLETLEHRLLYNSAVRHERPVFYVAGTTLNVSGSVHDDSITLNRRPDDFRLRLNGKEHVLPKTLTRFVVYGGAGNDQITSNVGRDVHTFMDGGTGDDVMQAGSTRDTMFGSTGDDALTGYSNNIDNYIYMDAGPGDDTLAFGRTMYGGSGDDSAEPNVTEYSSDDTIIGGIEHYPDNFYSHPATLTSRRGNLLFVYEADGDHDQRISRPTLREDGRLQIAVRQVGVAYDPAKPPAGTLLRSPFTAEQTAIAKRRGVVLVYTGVEPTGDDYALTILLPT